MVIRNLTEEQSQILLEVCAELWKTSIEEVTEWFKDDEVEDTFYEGETTETTDSCYINTDYVIANKDHQFTMYGSSYIKDQSICDEEMDDSIYYVNLAELREKKKAAKEVKAQSEKNKSDNDWKTFTKELEEANEDLTDGQMYDLLIEELQGYKFPTKFK